MSQQDDIKKLLGNYQRRLQALQERQALYGLDTPIAILTEIEDIEAQIEELHARLTELGPEGDVSAQPNITSASTVGDAGAKNSPAWVLWTGAGVLILVIGAGILVFWAGGFTNGGDGGPVSITAAPATAAATEQSNNPAVLPSPASTAPVFTVDELEARLSAANIVFSTGTDEDRARVRSYVTGPTSAYYLLAVNCLEVMGAQRFKQTVYLDMIDKWYTLRVGEDDYVAADGQLHLEELKGAMIEAHNEYYDDTAAAFEQLVEP